MIDYLIEIAFQNILVESIEEIIKDLILEEKNVASYNSTCKNMQIEWKTTGNIKKIFQENNNFGLFINLHKLTKKDLVLENCGLAAYKNKDNINLEINFQLSDVNYSNSENVSIKLMSLAKSIAEKHNLKNYYCGIDPAQDVETRLFTNETLGPLSIEN